MPPETTWLRSHSPDLLLHLEHSEAHYTKRNSIFLAFYTRRPNSPNQTSHQSGIPTQITKPRVNDTFPGSLPINPCCWSGTYAKPQRTVHLQRLQQTSDSKSIPKQHLIVQLQQSAGDWQRRCVLLPACQVWNIHLRNPIWWKGCLPVWVQDFVLQCTFWSNQGKLNGFGGHCKFDGFLLPMSSNRPGSRGRQSLDVPMLSVSTCGSKSAPCMPFIVDPSARISAIVTPL